MLVQISKIVAFIFYLIGIIGAFTINSKFDEFNDAMGLFFDTNSFSEVTGFVSFVFLLSNVAIGMIIHLLGEILNQTLFSNMSLKSNGEQEEKVNIEEQPKTIKEDDKSVEKTFKEDSMSKFSTLMVILILGIPVIVTIYQFLTK